MTCKLRKRPVASIVGVGHNPEYALVVAGGSIDADDKKLAEHASMIVAADSGADFLKQHDIKPDLIIGDFDSSNPHTIIHFKNLDVPVVSLVKDKDQTDTEAAVDLILGRGIETVIAIGCMGGERLDHELANVFLIEHFAEKGLDLIIYSQKTVIFGIPHGEKRSFTGKPGDWVTILPITAKIQGVSTSNLKFPLSDASLYRGSTLSVSNQMVNTQANVSLKSGFALIVLNRK